VALRRRLAPFLARTRGLVASPDRTGVFAGSTHALLTLAEVLRAQGVRRIGVEDPGHRWRTRVLRASGLEVVPVPVDGDGLRVDELGALDALVVSPDHHFPSGVTLAPQRRRSLVEWAIAGDRMIVEHDYDGHYRHDRPPAGTLQAMAPEHVVYVGSASALLVPTLRLGWAVLPGRLVDPVALHVFANAVATPRLSQLALAELIAAGHLDRQLRRARTAYKRRRQLALDSLARLAPAATLGGAPAGLYLSVALPDGTDEAAMLASARARGIAVDGVNEHAMRPQPPGLAVGFAALPEPTLTRALRELAKSVSNP
jgi:GntR family transcriptional regulator/MocR family aminotransferase